MLKIILIGLSFILLANAKNYFPLPQGQFGWRVLSNQIQTITGQAPSQYYMKQRSVRFSNAWSGFYFPEMIGGIGNHTDYINRDLLAKNQLGLLDQALIAHGLNDKCINLQGISLFNCARQKNVSDTKFSAAEVYDYILGRPQNLALIFNNDRQSFENSADFMNWFVFRDIHRNQGYMNAGEGACDGLSLASQKLPKPQKSVVVLIPDNNLTVRVTPTDAMALAAFYLQWAKYEKTKGQMEAHFVDSIGEAHSYFDAASWHLILSNMNRGLIVDIDSTALSFNANIKAINFKEIEKTSYNSVLIEAQVEYSTILSLKPSDNSETYIYRYALFLDPDQKVVGGQWSLTHPPIKNGEAVPNGYPSFAWDIKNLESLMTDTEAPWTNRSPELFTKTTHNGEPALLINKEGLKLLNTQFQTHRLPSYLFIKELFDLAQ